MNSDKKAGRVSGILFLTIFVLGVTIYQVLQGAILFSEDFLSTAAAHSNQLILSTLLGISSGVLSIIISIILLPIVNKHSQRLGYLYVSFCVLNLLAISIDNVGVLSMLEVSREYAKSESINLETYKVLGAVFYKAHWWTHYMSLLISCFPVFVLFYTMYSTKLIPRVLSVFGIIAVVLMFIEILASIFENSIGMNMLLPIALAQLLLPIWLMIKGFGSE
jgi:hypothetical protein